MNDFYKYNTSRLSHQPDNRSMSGHPPDSPSSLHQALLLSGHPSHRQPTSIRLGFLPRAPNLVSLPGYIFTAPSSSSAETLFFHRNSLFSISWLSCVGVLITALCAGGPG